MQILPYPYPIATNPNLHILPHPYPIEKPYQPESGFCEAPYPATPETMLVNRVNKPSTNEAPKRDIALANNVMHKMLQISTVACAIISVAPSMRLAGSIALRAFAFLSSVFNNAEHFKNDDIIGKTMRCMKSAIIALGTIAVAASSPMMIVACLAVDIALNTLDASKAFYTQDNEKGLTHLSAIAINTLTLAAIAASSWKLMVTAVAVSTAFMTGMAIKTVLELEEKYEQGELYSPWKSIDALCYAALAATGIASAITISEITSSNITDTHYNIKNNNNENWMPVFDKNGIDVAWVGPGESCFFSLPGTVERLYSASGRIIAHPQHYDYSAPIIVQHAIPINQLSTVPVGGLSLINKEKETANQ